MHTVHITFAQHLMYLTLRKFHLWWRVALDTWPNTYRKHLVAKISGKISDINALVTIVD